jgi:hypothetical protein
LLDTILQMIQKENSALTPLGREMNALKPTYFLGFLIVSTTCVFGACWAFLTVVNRPFPAFRPILREALAMFHHLLSRAGARRLSG